MELTCQLDRTAHLGHLGLVWEEKGEASEDGGAARVRNKGSTCSGDIQLLQKKISIIFFSSSQILFGEKFSVLIWLFSSSSSLTYVIFLIFCKCYLTSVTISFSIKNTIHHKIVIKIKCTKILRNQFSPALVVGTVQDWEGAICWWLHQLIWWKIQEGRCCDQLQGHMSPVNVTIINHYINRS